MKTMANPQPVETVSTGADKAKLAINLRMVISINCDAPHRGEGDRPAGLEASMFSDEVHLSSTEVTQTGANEKL